MNDNIGLDRYLVTPEQLERLRREGETERPIPRTVGIIGLAFLAEILLSVLAAFALGMWAAMNGGDSALLDSLPAWSSIVISLLVTAGAVGVILFFARRDTGRVGCERPFLGEYLTGALAGLGVFAGAVGICVLTGTLTIEGISPTFQLLPWLLILGGFLIQGLSEELLCRGLLMLAIARKWVAKGRKNAVLLGALLNAGLFAALHLGNSGIAPLALVNLFLFGVFASLYFLWRGNIWGIAAFHSLWNFTQGNVFGILVSGGDFGTSLLASTSRPAGALINGGSFGLEGGLAVTAVLVLGIAFILWRTVSRTAAFAPADRS